MLAELLLSILSSFSSFVPNVALFVFVMIKNKTAYDMEIGDVNVDVHTVCCSSRFFELRAMVSEATELLDREDIDGKAYCVEFSKFLCTFGPVSSALLQIVEGLFIYIWYGCRRCFRNRLKSDGCSI